MKLHLGCGEKYLNGYVNIDFPITEHTVQKKSVADEFMNILDLKYQALTVDEIRLHHLFEHFTRPIACALVTGWYSWLKSGGILHIEVPDFYKTGQRIMSCWISRSKKLVAQRHIFGSHEAAWAVHCEGYTVSSLSYLLKCYGFKIIKVKHNHWQGTYNFEIIAAKLNDQYSLADFNNITSYYLANFLLDRSVSENRLLDIWLQIYQTQMIKNWSK